MHHDTLTRHPIHSRDIIDWEFLAHQNLNQAFFESINIDPFYGPQWANLFRANEPIYQELVRKFFASFQFDASPCRYDPEHLGIRFRLGGEQKEMSLLELGWRIGLYTERKSKENATLSGLSRAKTVKEIRLLMEFWPSIGDGGFNVGNTKRGVVCNILYWLAKYLRSVREKKLIFGGMFMTRIARSFGLLTNEMRDVLSVKPLSHVFKKKSLIEMGVIMELYNRVCVWPVIRVVEEDNEAEEEVGGEAANEGAGGSAEMYRNMSQGDW
ncbi:hypothetical protein Tco_1268354 [Tanacetum coccineum]